MSRLLTIVGPTSSGKTYLSLLLAERLDGEIVSADSRQIYRYLDIGTAKPSKEARSVTVHHFIDILDPSDDYSAGRFGNDARTTILDILGRGKQPILVGGSGLYVKAVIDGLFEGPAKDPEVRERLESRLAQEGSAALWKALQVIDPVSALRMEPSKPRRIIRALEVYYATGRPLSDHHRDQSTPPSFEVEQFGLEWERKVLYDRIDQRVNWMISQGLVEEVRGLEAKGFDRNYNALNTVGYKEVFDFLKGNVKFEPMVDLIKRNTRRFAKRQLTWFRRDTRIHWIKIEKDEDIVMKVDTVTDELYGRRGT
jgi:tRNA dimethylallyltransferase